MNRVYIQLEEDELTLRWKVVFRDARNNEVIGVPARNLSIDEAGSLIDPLSFAFQYGTRYASEVMRRRVGLMPPRWRCTSITDVSHRAAGALDDEPEVVAYLDDDGRLVIESRERVARRRRLRIRHPDGLYEMWHLYTKKRKARSAALSDWDFVDLTPARKGTTSEAQATTWVVDGEWGEP
jgi:hypothetical protein